MEWDEVSHDESKELASIIEHNDNGLCFYKYEYYKNDELVKILFIGIDSEEYENYGCDISFSSISIDDVFVIRMYNAYLGKIVTKRVDHLMSLNFPSFIDCDESNWSTFKSFVYDHDGNIIEYHISYVKKYIKSRNNFSSKPNWSVFRWNSTA